MQHFLLSAEDGPERFIDSGFIDRTVRLASGPGFEGRGYRSKDDPYLAVGGCQGDCGIVGALGGIGIDAILPTTCLWQ